MTLYNIFSEFLEDISKMFSPMKLQDSKQRHLEQAVQLSKRRRLAIINKLEQYNGCILADSVGLGKLTPPWQLSSIMKTEIKTSWFYAQRLKDNWMTFRGNLINNPLSRDRLRYDVLFHTDLSRERGFSYWLAS